MRTPTISMIGNSLKEIYFDPYCIHCESNSSRITITLHSEDYKNIYPMDHMGHSYVLLIRYMNKISLVFVNRNPFPEKIACGSVDLYCDSYLSIVELAEEINRITMKMFGLKEF